MCPPTPAIVSQESISGVIVAGTGSDGAIRRRGLGGTAPVRLGTRLTDAVRRWSRTHADGLRCAALALVLVAVVSLSAALVWHAVAGERLGVTHRSHASPSAERAAGVPSPTDRTQSHGNGASSSRSSHSGASAPAAPTISGTAVAVGLIAVLGGAGLVLLRAQARSVSRRRPEPVREEQPEAAPTDAAGPPATEVTEVTDNAETDGDTGPPQPVPEPAQQVRPREDVPLAAPAAPTQQAQVNRTAPAAPAQESSRVVLYDRRLGQRVAFESRGRLQWEGHDVSCSTVDLSMRGAQLRLAGGPGVVAPPAVGTTVTVTLTLDGRTPTILKARVGWQRGDEQGSALGLQFLGVQKRQEALIQPIVLAGTPV
jgi:PilZ domain-containing protein